MELRDYLNVMRARRWVIIQAVFIVTLTALVVSLMQPPTYQGEAKILISEKDAGASLFGAVLPEFSSQPERGLQTQVQLMQVRPIAEEVIRELGLQMSPEELLARVEVSAVGQTNIIRITATDGDAERAAEIANAMAEGFVRFSRDMKRESLQAAIAEVEARLSEAQDLVLALGRRIQKEGKSDDLSAELQIATGLFSTLADKLEQLKINEQLEIGSGRVVSPAAVDTDPVSPKPVRNTALGLAVGLVFGLGMAFLYEYLDDTIKSTEELEELFGVPVLGVIPYHDPSGDGVRKLVVADGKGTSHEAEAYRMLRNALGFINFEHDITSILVTSAAPEEGKSTVAANLAASLAQAGSKVAFIECDFRRPTAQQFFNVNNMIGLSDVLLGTNSLKAALQRPRDDELLVLTAGKMPPNPAELLGSERMQELVASLKDWADWVIIDTPPLLAVSDAAAMSRWADGVLLVSRAGHATRNAARRSGDQLESVGARVVGVVGTMSLEERAARKGYYGYGYSYGGYGYGDYTYYDYYHSVQPEGRRARKGKGGKGAEVAAEAAPAPVPAGVYVPRESAGRQIARVIGRVLTGVLAFLLVLVIAAAAAYFLDQYFGWGLLGLLS